MISYIFHDSPFFSIVESVTFTDLTFSVAIYMLNCAEMERENQALMLEVREWVWVCKERERERAVRRGSY